MARYDLGTYYGPNNVDAINLIYIEKYSKTLDLQSIDLITTDFDSEEDLKEELESNNLLDKLCKNRELSIVYFLNQKYYKLPVLYSDSKKYLNKQYLWHNIEELSHNTNFLRELCKYCALPYDGINTIDSNLGYIRRYISDVEHSGHHFESEEFDKSLRELFDKITSIKYDKEQKIYITNYRRLRDLACFVINFNLNEKKESLKKSEDKKRLEKIKEEILKRQIEEENNYQQINLFNLMTSDDQKRIVSEKYHREK